MEYGEYERVLLKKIEDCNFVLGGLRDNPSFQKALEVFDASRKSLDDNWQFLADPSKMLEARITKMSLLSILNLIPNYEHDLAKYKEELEKLHNQDKEILKDYDSH